MQCTFILWAFVFSEVDSTAAHKVPSASGLFLWSFSPLITPLASLCGLSNRPSVKTCQCRRAKFLLFSLNVDRRECFTAGISLPLLSSLSLYLSCSRLCFGDATLDSLCSGKMLTWRRAPRCTVCCKPQWNAPCRTAECVSAFMSPLWVFKASSSVKGLSSAGRYLLRGPVGRYASDIKQCNVGYGKRKQGLATWEVAEDHSPPHDFTK